MFLKLGHVYLAIANHNGIANVRSRMVIHRIDLVSYLPSMPLPCSVYQWRIWRLSKIVAVCSYSTLKGSALSIATIHSHKQDPGYAKAHSFHPNSIASNFKVPCIDIVRSDDRF